MATGYWDALTGSRVSRRRAIAGTGGATLAAAFLAACGGGNKKDSGDKKSQGSSLLFTPTDTTKQATAGGNWVRAYPGQPLSQNVDPYGAVGLNTGISLFAHSRLFQYKPTMFPGRPDLRGRARTPQTASSFRRTSCR